MKLVAREETTVYYKNEIVTMYLINNGYKSLHEQDSIWVLFHEFVNKILERK